MVVLAIGIFCVVMMFVLIGMVTVVMVMLVLIRVIIVRAVVMGMLIHVPVSRVVVMFVLVCMAVVAMVVSVIGMCGRARRCSLPIRLRVGLCADTGYKKSRNESNELPCTLLFINQHIHAFRVKRKGEFQKILTPGTFLDRTQDQHR
jgi:hypothetical protein